MDNDKEKIAIGNGGPAAACGPSPEPGCWACWMPIETAPHDNATWVLVCDGDQIDIAIFGRHPLDVQEEMEFCWTDGERELYPTHWMPLPNPPNPSVDARQAQQPTKEAR